MSKRVAVEPGRSSPSSFRGAALALLAGVGAAGCAGAGGPGGLPGPSILSNSAAFRLTFAAPTCGVVATESACGVDCVQVLRPAGGKKTMIQFDTDGAKYVLHFDPFSPPRHVTPNMPVDIDPGVALTTYKFTVVGVGPGGATCQRDPTIIIRP